MLDAESYALLHDILPAYAPTPEMEPAQARLNAQALGRLLQGQPVAMPTSEHSINAGDHEIAVRLYRPQGTTGGWLLWIHGGGFTTGGLDTHDTLCRRLAKLSGQAVVSLDYRLAPEHPYPAALNDCEAVLSWLFLQADKLSFDPARCAIGGSSAGGNLAAALTLRNRDGARLPIRRQLLVYPSVDATLSSESVRRHATGYQLTAAMMQRYLDYYCGDILDRREPHLSPLFAPDFSGLPTADLIIADLDPLADEGIAYARALENADVVVGLRIYDGVMHGFFAQAGVLSKARDAQAKLCDALRADFG
jgi:acetyl esterase